MNAPSLHHVSERPGIATFEPRMPSRVSEDSVPVVWAIDAAHLPNYLLPRDCPRVCWRDGRGVSAQDRRRLLGGMPHVVAISADWLPRVLATTLHVYSFDAKPFVCIDAVAGYHVAHRAVTPLGSFEHVPTMSSFTERNVQLRIVGDAAALRDLAATVAASTLPFSCIRLAGRDRGS
jgi:hypothetical protein